MNLNGDISVHIALGQRARCAQANEFRSDLRFALLVLEEVETLCSPPL